MTIHLERSALGFALLTFVASCARAPDLIDESADFSTEFAEEADANVATIVRSAIHDAGLTTPDAGELIRTDLTERADIMRAPLQTSAAPSGDTHDASSATTPDQAVSSPGTAESNVEDASVATEETTKPSPAKDATVAAESSASKDGSVPTKAITTTDASISPAEPARGADAGVDKVTPSADAGALVQPCTPGRYTGEFSGQLAQAELGSVTFDGSIVLQLVVLTADGSTLGIESGSIEATDSRGIPLHIDVDGRVDCASKQLKSGKLYGRYGGEGSASAVTFEGTVSGTYEGTPPALAGGWSVPIDDPNASAKGTYRATLED